VAESTSNSPDPAPTDVPARQVAESGSESPRRVRVVRYGVMGYVGEFGCKPSLVLGWGNKVVVQTERGIELGEPVGVPCVGGGCDLTVPDTQLHCYVKNSGTEFCRLRAGRILRVANEQDIREHNHLNAHLRDDVAYCAEAAFRLGIDAKIVTAEHLLGGERIVFYFAAPTRIDFRQLVKELAQRYRTRIEMRQVGSRDEARLVGDYEVCGRECCCKNFLKKLRPVNMKMAKLQKSTLDPSKVSGRCGRLRCCLRFEHYGYEELAHRLPRTGSRVGTEFGPGTVVDRQVLTQLVSVRMDDNRVVVIPLEEITAFDLPPPPEPPPTATSAPAAPPERGGRSRRDRRSTRGPRPPTAPVATATEPAPLPAPAEQETHFVEGPIDESPAAPPVATPEQVANPPEAGRAGTREPVAEAPRLGGPDSPARRRRRRRRRHAAGGHGPAPPAPGGSRHP
jgi:cell fate regulator YaaT (PSP1 superfamily)